MGAVVYWSGKPYSYVHKTPDCRTYALRGAHQKNRHELRETDLSKITAPKFCKTCFPSAPRKIKVHHPLCKICHPERVFPCEHNGAVAVIVKIRNGHRRSDDDSEYYTALRWVWPENAANHRLVNSVHPR